MERTQRRAGGRRAGIGLTAKGRAAAESAILGHAGNIRRHFLDSLTPQQAEAIRDWSKQTIDRIGPRCTSEAP